MDQTPRLSPGEMHKETRWGGGAGAALRGEGTH